ncbi:uncharacterized protein B0I36DRAFT_348176 [Microdochium trichocladiopsis]|uniref:Uncharacterized protein n=1 Tax=Microdochium trichocladiopsis TaxID=1682393 RepID=A0A9P8Y6K6_9PEZI|nr:uncharacterized protein B0I36DRAFT_348176 [Microdochium trichocladiopsis]KAH7033060.1 hypothetical protein B0I36DRAFT_348176 [Microdochium trichocladiopsis]
MSSHEDDRWQPTPLATVERSQARRIRVAERPKPTRQRLPDSLASPPRRPRSKAQTPPPAYEAVSSLARPVGTPRASSTPRWQEPSEDAFSSRGVQPGVQCGSQVFAVSQGMSETDKRQLILLLLNQCDEVAVRELAQGAETLITMVTHAAANRRSAFFDLGVAREVHCAKYQGSLIAQLQMEAGIMVLLFDWNREEAFDTHDAERQVEAGIEYALKVKQVQELCRTLG